MSGLRLLEVAAQAEMLRLRQEARRLARMAALLVAAAVFALFALAWLHTAAWAAIAAEAGPVVAALWVMLADAVIATILLLVSRRGPGPAELEALHIRRLAMAELRTGSLLGDILQVVRSQHPIQGFGVLVVEALMRAAGRR